MLNIHKLLFFNTMMIGTLIAISSLSWFTTWIGLEINLLSLMPLMKNFKNKYAPEATIKYFIVQAMASALLLFSILIFSNNEDLKYDFSSTASIMVNSALLLKMGAAPFHFWFPEVMSGMNWEMAFILMTWQKIAPMILITYTMKTPIFLSIIIILSSMISGLQGLNQTCLRKILAYSSINHVSWMLSALLNSSSMWFMYFIIYSMINLNIIIIFSNYKIFFIKQLSNLFSYNKKIKFFFMLNFLSLGGLPPFLGFLPKWLTVNHLVENKFFTMTFLLIIFTLISLYMYLRLTFSTFTLNSEESLVKPFMKLNYMYMYINLVSLLGLILCSTIIYFY
nr:NADH dehydrogenase subunit 2 [Lixus subtilis]